MPDLKKVYISISAGGSELARTVSQGSGAEHKVPVIKHIAELSSVSTRSVYDKCASADWANYKAMLSVTITLTTTTTSI